MRTEPERNRIRLEKALDSEDLDFSAAYMTVSELSALMAQYPKIAGPRMVRSLKGILEKPQYISQTQAFFLYRNAAEVLVSLLTSSRDPDLIQLIQSVLTDVMGSTTEHQHRAAAEALGNLPLNIRSPDPAFDAVEDMPHVTWKSLVKEKRLSSSGSPKLYGRSMVADLDGGNHAFVIKMVPTRDASRHLHKEAVWMQHFLKAGYRFPVRFDIPEPLKIRGSFVFRIKNLPIQSDIRGRMPRHKGYYAIGFFAPRAYFSYPNDHRPQKQLPDETLQKILFDDAWLFGRLTAMGIVHSAPIPLFHNRVQIQRRADHGIYEWQRGGRLDRWLESCRYPNFGETGIRDFEHFITIEECGGNLYAQIGNQLLSLILVTGSFFRNKDLGRVGPDENGIPADARELFREPFLKELIQGIFLRYYEGFVGKECRHAIPVDFDRLTFRIIEEMGVDHHMEEILRVADQNAMADEDFIRVLAQAGQSAEDIEAVTKGQEDITVLSGPHLGGFNARISLPEMIEFLETASALCVAGRFEQDHSLTRKGRA